MGKKHAYTLGEGTGTTFELKFESTLNSDCNCMSK
jgi:hypothetical protein